MLETSTQDMPFSGALPDVVVITMMVVAVVVVVIDNLLCPTPHPLPSQTPWLLNASIKENILFGRPYKVFGWMLMASQCQQLQL